MTETIITVSGNFSGFYRPERAQLEITVSHDGADRDTVVGAASRDAEAVTARISRSVDDNRGPVVSWSSDALRVWSERAWSPLGEQLPPVHHAVIGFIVTVSDFVELARMAGELALVPGVVIADLRWSLTDATRAMALAEVRSKAVDDAVVKATGYAGSVGLATIRAIAIADEGMLDGAGSPAGGRHPVDTLRMASATSGATELRFTPADLRIEAVVDARFSAT